MTKGDALVVTKQGTGRMKVVSLIPQFTGGVNDHLSLNSHLTVCHS